MFPKIQFVYFWPTLRSPDLKIWFINTVLIEHEEQKEIKYFILKKDFLELAHNWVNQT